ncbi:MAG TPA: phage Gp37/Gp68 family protein [Pyrinomonadaceae bacterium]|jgi:protein gp37|nr:phage Gp37/Gp68 family protein [Pyrinomonadaceae bacterium]
MSTNIEWTGETWNPISGCSRKSEGCQNCYAEVMTKRLAAMGQEKYKGLLNDQNRFNGTIKFDEKALLKPLSVKKPTIYFVNSMSDLFHENVKDEWIDKVFAVMALCPQHTFQILTKRADRMKAYFESFNQIEAMGRGWNCANWLIKTFGKEDGSEKTNIVVESNFRYGLQNVWLGVSVENQKTADERIPLLLNTPAAIRFLSCEPLLGEVDLTRLNQTQFTNGQNALSGKREISPYSPPKLENKIDWVIIGGESGQIKLKTRDCMHEWIRSIVQQCRSAQVPVFVKQLGTNSFYFDEDNPGEYEWKTKNKKGGDISEFPEDLQIRQFPKEKIS